MNQPVPVSTKGAGVTVTGPWPQSMVISAPTLAVMRATAGVASWMASWTGEGSRLPRGPEGHREQQRQGPDDSHVAGTVPRSSLVRIRHWPGIWR